MQVNVVNVFTLHHSTNSKILKISTYISIAINRKGCKLKCKYRRSKQLPIKRHNVNAYYSF